METIREHVEKINELINAAIESGEYTLINLKKSNVVGYIDATLVMADETEIRGSFHEKGYACWFTNVLGEPKVSKKNEAAVCERVQSEYKQVRKDILLKEIEERKNELNCL